MFSKKQTIILIILIFVLIGGIFLYKQKYQKWPWQKKINIASPSVALAPTPSAPSESPQVKTERGKIMEDVASRITQLSPVDPVLGGRWFVSRFWFVSGSDNDLYVEYEDGHILRMILIKAIAKENVFEYEVESYFEPGESGWLLKTGQDNQSNKDLDLYEFDKDWTKRN